MFSYLYNLFLIWFSQNKIVTKMHRRLFFFDAPYTLLIWILTALCFRAVTANAIVTFRHSIIISFFLRFSPILTNLFLNANPKKSDSYIEPLFLFNLQSSTETAQPFSKSADVPSNPHLIPDEMLLQAYYPAGQPRYCHQRPTALQHSFPRSQYRVRK